MPIQAENSSHLLFHGATTRFVPRCALPHYHYFPKVSLYIEKPRSMEVAQVLPWTTNYGCIGVDNL